jgi:ABC-type bacteriocin/lantibiotic exporter with double-glycine peptidase domain
MLLLPVSHRQQSQSSDCLATCAAMLLEYLHVPFKYEHLLRLLRVRSFGTEFPNLRYLESLGLSVLIEQGTVETLRGHLERGLPPIVFVNTGLLSYWQEQTGHALVVLAIEDEKIYLNDPRFADAPKAIPLTEFEAAWIEQDQEYAVVGLDEIELN